WLRFFLTGVRDQSVEAKARVKALATLRENYRKELEKERSSQRLMQGIHFLFGNPIISIRQIEAGLNLSNYRSAQRLVSRLESLGIIREITGKSRNRLYQADQILHAIDAALGAQ
ncbi:MAG: hypothetical protein DRI32_09640, partial [Chloroflexi bacterium]